MEKLKLGFIVNPIAGLGGTVGFKGTDGKAEEALKAGAVPKANLRAEEALKELLPLKDRVLILTGGNDMGERCSKAMGFETRIVWKSLEKSSCFDTVKTAENIIQGNASFLLFAGGDGTAADIYRAVGLCIPALGIPAGVKIHSPVYAKSPPAAGKLAFLFMTGSIRKTKEAEVLDIDEEMYRAGFVSTKLLGYLNVPDSSRYVQNKKAPTPLSEKEAIHSIAKRVIEEMEDNVCYIIGAGTTTKGIMDELNLPCTLIGTDIIKNKKLIAKDVCGKEIMKITDGAEIKLILTVTGGQGFLFGRGNQQITPDVIRKAGRDNITVIAAPEKLYSLKGEPLLIDTSDKTLDMALEGYIKVISGYNESTVCRIKTP